MRTLAHGPISTQVKMAEVVGSHQPSISRSLDTLFDRGLVTKRDGCYQLTQLGQSIAESDQIERMQFNQFSHDFVVRATVAGESLRLLADMLDEWAEKLGRRDDSAVS